jgi:hypothetical protein
MNMSNTQDPSGLDFKSSPLFESPDTRWYSMEPEVNEAHGYAS